MPTTRSLRSQKKQARLSFQPLSSSSPARDKYSDSIQDRLANVRFIGSRHSSPLLNRSRQNVGTQPELPTPEPSSQHEQLPKPNAEPPTSSPLSSLPERFDEPAFDHEHEDEDEEEDIVIPPSKRRRIEQTIPPYDATPTRRSTRLHISQKPNVSRVEIRSNLQSSQERTSSELGSAETTGDDEEEAITLTKPKLQGRRGRVKSHDHVDLVDSDSEPTISASRKDRRSPRSKRSKKDEFVVDDGEVEYLTSDQEAETHTTQVREQRSGSGRKRSRREKDELAADLEDLQDSEQESSMKRNRTRGGPVTTQRDKTREHLELLRRRRAGERIPRVIDSDDEDDKFEDTGVELDTIGHPESHPEDFEGEPQDSTVGVENTGVERPFVDDDDFIVDDVDTSRIGRPHPDMPLMFTSHAAKKPKELFVYVVEWLIKNKIAPAFSRDDEIYQLAWNKVIQEFQAQAGSRLISSAWNADFKHAILARPYMTHSFGEMLEESCDACNKANHPAKYAFQFSGEPYHEDTLEPVDSEDEAGDDDDDENKDETDNRRATRPTYDAKGHLLPSEGRTFYLGRYCAANAEMGHKLSHWKYHLNQSLLEYLEEQGVLSAEAIVTRDKWKKKKREKEAERILDIMEETGKVRELWQGLQDDLEDARFGMEGHEAKGGRNRARIGAVRARRADGRLEEWAENGRRTRIAESESEDDEE